MSEELSNIAAKHKDPGTHIRDAKLHFHDMELEFNCNSTNNCELECRKQPFTCQFTILCGISDEFHFYFGELELGFSGA